MAAATSQSWSQKRLSDNSVVPRSHSKIGNASRRFFAALSATVLIVVTGFRYGIGQDYFYTYVPYFRRVCLGGGQDDMEIGFYLINKIVSIFTDNPAPVFVICSVIFFTCVYFAILKDSPSPAFSVFLLIGMSFFFVFMNAMRQMVAVSILMLSMRFIERRRLVPFVVMVFLASTFHISALAFVITYLFPKLRINIPFMACAILGFFVLKNEIATGFISLIDRTVYANYVGSIFDTEETGSIVIAMNIVVLAFSLAVPKIYHEEYGAKYNLYIWCQFAASLIAILSGALVLSQRIRWMFGLPAIVLIPMTASRIPDRKLRLLVQWAIALLYVIYIAITIGMWNGNGVVPYATILFQG